ncbi:MAG: thioredoxin [Thermodesulfobacteriota bacterium]|nr:thioredoxin [Thermodesulfobacteriota bacterium]
MTVRKLTGKTEFDSAIQNGVALVDFNASWCAPCRAQAPIVEKLAENFSGKAMIAETDVDENRDAAVAYDIRSIPTLVLFKNGEEVERLVGLQSEETLVEILEKTI